MSLKSETVLLSQLYACDGRCVHLLMSTFNDGQIYVALSRMPLAVFHFPMQDLSLYRMPAFLGVVSEFLISAHERSLSLRDLSKSVGEGQREGD